jgi:hypothetical protein
LLGRLASMRDRSARRGKKSGELLGLGAGSIFIRVADRIGGRSPRWVYYCGLHLHCVSSDLMQCIVQALWPSMAGHACRPNQSHALVNALPGLVGERTTGSNSGRLAVEWAICAAITALHGPSIRCRSVRAAARGEQLWLQWPRSAARTARSEIDPLFLWTCGTGM